jgi:hypothetical protein
LPYWVPFMREAEDAEVLTAFAASGDVPD